MTEEGRFVFACTSQVAAAVLQADGVAGLGSYLERSTERVAIGVLLFRD